MNSDFNEYLGKYNEYLEKGIINANADRSFLDKEDNPTDEMIIKLFITPDDMKHALDFSKYSMTELGSPDDIKTLEGSHWILSKLIWYRDGGRVITFDIIQISPTMVDIEKGRDGLIYPNNEEIIDIEHEEVIDEDYHKLLEEAIKIEDYSEAARLRDWAQGFKDLHEQLAPVMARAIEDENFKEYYAYIKTILKYKNTL